MQTFQFTFAKSIAWLGLASLMLLMDLRPDVCHAAKDEVDQVAGRTLDEWTGDLKSDNEILRARAAKTLIMFGDKAVEALTQALNDESPAVQYWAAGNLGLLKTDAQATLRRLQELEGNSATQPAVATAAAFALCQLEDVDAHIGLLIEQVQIPDRATACCAADFLQRLGPKAKQAVDVLEQTYEVHSGQKKQQGVEVDYHIGHACKNALRVIAPEWKPKG